MGIQISSTNIRRADYYASPGATAETRDLAALKAKIDASEAPDLIGMLIRLIAENATGNFSLDVSRTSATLTLHDDVPPSTTTMALQAGLWMKTVTKNGKADPAVPVFQDLTKRDEYTRLTTLFISTMRDATNLPTASPLSKTHEVSHTPAPLSPPQISSSNTEALQKQLAANAEKMRQQTAQLQASQASENALVKENEALTIKVAELSTEQARISQEKELFEQTNAALRQTITDLNQKLEEFESLKQELARSQQLVREQQQAISQLEQRAQFAESDKHAALAQAQHLAERIAQLEKAAKSAISPAALESLKEQLLQANTDRTAALEQATTSEARLATLAQKATQLQDQLKSALAENTQKHQALEQASTLHLQDQEKLAAALAQQAELEHKHAEAIKAGERNLLAKQEQLTALESNLQTTEALLANGKQKQADLEESLAEKEGLLAAQQAQHDSATTTSREKAQQQAASISELEKKLAGQSQVNEKLKKDLDVQVAAIDAFKESAASSQQQLKKQLAEARQQISEARAATTAAEEKTRITQELFNKFAETNDAAKTLLTNQLQEQQRAISKLEQQAQSAEREKNAALEQATQLAKQISELEEAAKSAISQDKLKSLEEQLLKANTELTTALEQAATSKAHLATLEQTLTQLQAKLEGTSTVHQQDQRQLAALQSQLQETKAFLTAESQTQAAALRELEASTTSIQQQLKEQLNQAHAKTTAAQTTLSDYKEQLNEMTSSYQESELALEQFKKTLMDPKKQKELTDELAQARKHLTTTREEQQNTLAKLNGAKKQLFEKDNELKRQANELAKKQIAPQGVDTDQLQKDKQNAAAKILELQALLSETNSLSEQTDKTAQDLARRKQALAAQEAGIKQREEKLKGEYETLDKTSQEMHTIRLERDQLREQIEALTTNATNTVSQEQVTNLSAELVAANEQLAALERELTVNKMAHALIGRGKDNLQTGLETLRSTAPHLFENVRTTIEDIMGSDFVKSKPLVHDSAHASSESDTESKA